MDTSTDICYEEWWKVRGIQKGDVAAIGIHHSGFSSRQKLL